jgi:hypothetical protein
MSRSVCLALVLVGLVAAPGCNGGFANCRRPSFMEFRSPCRRQAEPCAPACEPACGPACGPAADAAPCCSEGTVVPGGSAPIVTEPGTFS